MKKLEIYKNENYALTDAFDQAVVNIHIQKEKNGYKTFTVCGCESGDGSTTVAINLAVALAASGWKTVLIDGDMRKRSVYKRLNEDIKIGFSNYLAGNADINEIVYETTNDLLYYIPSGEITNNPVRLLCSNKMDTMKKVLEDNFDFIIYDMPAANTSMDASAVAVKTDASLLVVAMGKTSKKGLAKATHDFKEKNVNLLGVVINKVDINEYKRYSKDYDYFKKERYARNAEAAMKKNRRKK